MIASGSRRAVWGHAVRGAEIADRPVQHAPGGLRVLHERATAVAQRRSGVGRGQQRHSQQTRATRWRPTAKTGLSDLETAQNFAADAAAYFSSAVLSATRALRCL
eukprot:1167983-Prymnesium_polylepis.1